MPAVSQVVPAAANGTAVIGFAAPYDTPHGRRVFSGAFDVTHSPLAAYLPSVSAIKPNAVELLDADGTVIASNRGAQSQRLPVIKPTGRQALNRRVVFDGQTFRVAARPVAGAPWQLVVTVPEAGLYAPLSAVGRGLAWGGLAIFVFASLLIAGLVGRLLTARTRLTGDIATREQVEHKLRDAQARLYQVFAEAPIGMALVDLDGAWRQVNQALCTMLRYSEPELLRCTREQVTHPTTSSLTAKELRLLEITAGAPTVKGKRTGVWATRERMRQAERELAQQAEASYTRTVRDWQATRPAKAAGPAKVGASVTPGHA